MSSILLSIHDTSMRAENLKDWVAFLLQIIAEGKTETEREELRKKRDTKTVRLPIRERVKWDRFVCQSYL